MSVHSRKSPSRAWWDRTRASSAKRCGSSAVSLDHSAHKSDRNGQFIGPNPPLDSWTGESSLEKSDNFEPAASLPLSARFCWCRSLADEGVEVVVRDSVTGSGTVTSTRYVDGEKLPGLNPVRYLPWCNGQALGNLGYSIVPAHCRVASVKTSQEALSTSVATTTSATNSSRSPARRQGIRPASASARSHLTGTPNRRAICPMVRSRLDAGEFMPQLYSSQQTAVRHLCARNA
jgi:hypothetical protein